MVLVNVGTSDTELPLESVDTELPAVSEGAEFPAVSEGAELPAVSEGTDLPVGTVQSGDSERPMGLLLHPSGRSTTASTVELVSIG